MLESISMLADCPPILFFGGGSFASLNQDDLLRLAGLSYTLSSTYVYQVTTYEHDSLVQNGELRSIA